MVKDCRQMCESNLQEILLVQQYKRLFIVQEYKNSPLLSKNIKGVSLLSKNTKGFLYCPRIQKGLFIVQEIKGNALSEKYVFVRAESYLPSKFIPEEI